MMDPLAVYKYCVRCGEQTENKDNVRSCKSCGYVFYINSSPATSALVISDGKILLTTRAIDPHKGKLDTPGGFLELNETFEDAIKREVKEELGVEVRDLEYFNSTIERYLFSGVEGYLVNVNFKVTLESEDFKPADDVSSVSYYSLDEIDYDEIAFPSLVSVLEKLII